MTAIEHVHTPFGAARIETWQRGPTKLALFTDEASSPAQARAAVYGAKALGAERIVELVVARPLTRLLAASTYAVPHDLVDLTRGHYLTFFEGKGYGFLPQHTPFCLELRAGLGAASRAVDPMSAGRGVYAAIDHWEQLEEAKQWGAHFAGMRVSPTAFLARELELCYVPLCCLGPEPALRELVDRMAPELPVKRGCPCATAMQPTRQRGLIGDDWRTWL